MKRWAELVFGRPKDPADPAVHGHLTLAAILAWVGLGADGLSSACYGPEATFLALGEHRYLAPFLVLATVLTVSILSAAYSGTIAAFPSGGGGYSVATRTLGRYAGMACGCALVLDYVLTVGISVAAGADAIFSLLPLELRTYKVEAAVLAVLGLMALNFRGVKESVIVLLPVFFLFLAFHAVLIVLAIALPPSGAATAATPAATGTSLGWAVAALLVLKAYSHGAGTYTGIEAVSNSLSILREPRVKTARWAMLYMAISLAAVAGGLLVGYLRQDVASQAGKTLNAVLAGRVFGETGFGQALVSLTLASEALLLLVAAQAGFIDGPRVLASMAVDSWVPRWFSLLSDRLVVSNGILLVGLGGIAAIVLTGGHVEKLVIVYSFSVFVTFLLSQAGMVRYWLEHREKGHVRRAATSIAAGVLSAVVLVSLLLTYGVGAAGAALASILALAILCFLIRRHYAGMTRGLDRLKQLITAAETDPHRGELRPIDRGAPTAVFFVSGYNGAGMHLLLGLHRLFPNYFRQFVFVSAGVVDFDRFKGHREVENLRSAVETDLAKYVPLVGRWGYAAEARCSVGVDVVEELDEQAAKIATEYPRATFFCGDLLFRLPTLITRILHSGTASELQRRLSLRGLPLLVLPLRL